MPLFDVLPADLFKPLASPSRRLYSDLLLHLYRRTFELSAEAPRRAEVMREIEDFLAGWEARNGAAIDEEAPEPTADDRARSFYQRLVETGWLVEHRERYVRLVDFNPEASVLVQVFAEIERGEALSYGGAVLGVLSALEGAAADPEDRSESLRNALRGAGEFVTHMRTVSISLRQAEERILKQPSVRDVFRHFFEDFVVRHLIGDYKTLHTKENPFRFRAAIVGQANQMLMNDAVVAILGEAYAREGRAEDGEAGQERVRRELAEIIAVFDAADRHLDEIDATVARIERRIVNAARYMDRIGDPAKLRLTEAIKALADDAREEIAVPTALLPRFLPLGPVHVPAPRRERMAVAPSVIREVTVDPAAILYARAKEEYVRRTRVTAPVLATYVDKVLGERTEVRGRDILLRTVEDFVAFQRLRELPSIFNGALAARFELVLLPGRCSNDWISCQDFLIRRRGGRNTDAA
ncbi:MULTISPECIES: Wadjet anti-phage system protein JetA family protein [unclassified Aureimonas]|uniref:Wadjet anti-phage system protein JetA family protein n=1 Tax=unclassified Aureimonas TaxID=2615206 RepID=UPI0006F23C89|nr:MULTISPECIES: Wadjet anti-phage system protein JetA family protein [unclassified Aureimonas]